MAGSGRSVKTWLLRGFLASLGLCLLLIAAVLLTLHSLDRSWIKPRIQALVLQQRGFEIDYRTAQFRELAGLVIEDLVVRSPLPVRSTSPDFLRVGRLRLSWTVSSWFGDAPALGLELEQVVISVVADEQGRTTFDFLPPSGSPSVPLSRQAEDLLQTTATFSDIRASALSAELVRSQRTTPVERFRLDGLGLTARRSVVNKAPSVALDVGTQSAPLQLALTRTAQDAKITKANVSCVLGLQLSGTQAEGTWRVRVEQQDFAQAWQFEELLKLQAKFRFDPTGKRTHVELSELA
ncbi:MAG TPA: hypothetical protein VMF89_06545, partial [Polyangiales bacterium]|nr:hypothetical protein [Polyangiales bacterium]